ncbi:hypothetical protein, partial [Streptomyces sp. NPDC005969]|uniref:hypothetical protein n=1 Tax=Streptomyces sp. NPDC005969 TaxID=3156722 RepID=UPI0033F4F2D6
MFTACCEVLTRPPERGAPASRLISDTSGEVVGFGARKLRDDDNGPKYLNT